MSLRSFLFLILTTSQVVIICFLVFFLQEKQREKEQLALDLIIKELEPSEAVVEPARDVNIPFANYLTSTGKVESSTVLKISTSVQGRVEDVFARVGDIVEEGDQLIYIEDDEYRYIVEEKTAQLQGSVAKHKTILNKIKQPEMLAKEQELAEAKANMEKLGSQLKVYASLLKKEAVSQGEYAVKKKEYKNSEAYTSRVTAELEELKKYPGKWEQKIHLSEIEMKKAALHQAEMQLENCMIIAPIEGIVLDVKTEKGENVTKDENVIYLASMSPMRVRAKVKADQCWRIVPERGLRAIAVHQCNPKIYHILTFERISPIADENGCVDVLFKFNPREKPVYFGESYDVYIEASSSEDTSCFEYQFKRGSL